MKTIRGWKCYEEAATRLEYRLDEPPSRDYTDRYVAAVQALGVEAVWHAAVNATGLPLYPSNVLAVCHPHASREDFQYLIHRFHEIGRPVLSWYPANLSSAALREHPGWRVRYLGRPDETCDALHPCFNSPFGELLPRLAAEIVGDVGFDGLWFDGWYMPAAQGRPACACEACRQKYRRDTGRELPPAVDWQDRNFKEWVVWRYDCFTQLMERIVQAVHAVKPAATICFNNMRRYGGGPNGWMLGTPLRSLNLDALMSSETGVTVQDISMKIQRAFNCARGVETWIGCQDVVQWVPDVDVPAVTHSALACIAAGGTAACGMGCRIDLNELAYVFKPLQAAVAPRRKYAGGKTVPYAAILLSQRTQDFWARDNPNLVWQEVHGANELLNQCHLQTDIIFDEHLTASRLQPYPVVILGNAVCLGRAAAAEIAAYVAGGGVVLACSQAGLLDEWGAPHPRPALDDLLGIRARKPMPAACGHVTLAWQAPGFQSRGCPYLTVAIAPLTQCLDRPYGRMPDFAYPAAGVEMLARLRAFGHPGDPDVRWPEDAETQSGGLWRRPVGRGWIIYTPIAVFPFHIFQPTLRIAEFFKPLFTRLAAPPVTLEGPRTVRVNTRIQADGAWAVHLLNNPGFRFAGYAGVAHNYTMSELVPARNLTLVLNGVKVRSARSAVSGRALAVRQGNRVRLPVLEQEEVVLLKVK